MSKDVRVVNKKANFEYFIERRIECGLVLEGWEVKSLRAGKGQLIDSYVLIKDNELWLLGSLITPLSTITHTDAKSDRTRKLLLHKAEIKKIVGTITQKGMTCIATVIYLKGSRFKCEIAVAKGKKLHDKRETIKQREWDINKNRVLNNR